MASETRLRSEALRAAPKGVDGDVIRGVAVITKGEALGHGLYIDDEFLSQVAAAGVAKSTAGLRGLKCRYAHPGLFEDGLGSTIGRFKSFRVDGNTVRADLHLLRGVADRSGLAAERIAYIRALAEEAPDLFGASIVFERDVAAERSFIVAHSDDDEGFESPDPENANNYRHARLASLKACDAVDEPAANPAGLFSQPRDTSTLPPTGLEVVRLENVQETTAMSEKTPQPTAATLDELKAEFGARPEFVIEQLDAKATLDQARAAHLKLERDEMAAEAERLRGEIAEKSKRDEAAQQARAHAGDAGHSLAIQFGGDAEDRKLCWENPDVRLAFGSEKALEAYKEKELSGAIVPPHRDKKNAKNVMAKMARAMDENSRDAGVSFAMGKSGPDYALITVKGIFGNFYKAIGEDLETSWASKVMWLNSESNQETETYRWLGHVPQLREWKGGRRSRGLPINSYSITNLTWEATLEFDIEDWRFDKTGQINLRFSELATRATRHWEKRITEQIELDGLCYDGQNFFDTDHPAADGASDNSSTYNNDLTNTEVGALDVVDPGAPTRDEMVDVLIGVIQYSGNYKDGYSEPYNDGANSYCIMVPTHLYGPTVAAVNDRLRGSGSSNTLSESLPWQLQVIRNSRLDTANDVFFVFREDSRMKPFIGQEPVSPQLTFLGEGSDTAFLDNRYLGGVKAVREVGYGQWAHAIKATLS